MRKFGIMATTWHETHTMYIRHWVCLPDGKITLFDNEDAAHQFALAMDKSSRENGIVGLEYRARVYPK